MPQSRGGTIQRAALQRTLRVGAAVVAVALAVGAVWLIVTAKNAKHAQVGALLGFWSLLMAAFSGLGGRAPRPADPSGSPVPGTAVGLRPIGWLDRIEDAERRVGYERELLELVRHEIASSLAPEIANLRSDVAALRGEILDTVGGQIRLERIETTRMIGSDLEALQRELRQLRTGPATDVPEPVEVREAITAAAVPPPATPAPPLAAAASAPPLAETSAAPPAETPTAEPVETAVGVAPADTRTAAVPVDPEPHEYEDEDDPFALLPRSAPYVEPEPEPESVGAYSGRRRADDDQASTGGRHSVEDRDWSSSAPRRIGGRRRRDDDAGHDVLARILERESPARSWQSGGRRLAIRLRRADGHRVPAVVGQDSVASRMRAHWAAMRARRALSSVSRLARPSPRARSSVACTVSRTPGTDSSTPSSSTTMR